MRSGNGIVKAIIAQSGWPGGWRAKGGGTGQG